MRIAAFVLVLLLLLSAADYASYYEPTKGYINKLTNTDGSRFGVNEVAPIIDELSVHDGSTRLILGDSVANQLLEGLMGQNKDIKIVPINRAITFAGQYVLAKEYMDSHPEATDIYIMFYAGTLASDIDPELSYQYIAMPFIEKGYVSDLEGPAMDKLTKTFGSFFLKPAVLEYIDLSGINRTLYLNAVSDISDRSPEVHSDATVVSDISVYYLTKLYDLCAENGVVLHIVSTPLCDSEAMHETCQNITEVFADTSLGEMFPSYCDGFVFYNEEMFLDGVHFKPEYKNRETLNPMIEEMLRRDPSLSGLSDIFDTTE